MKRKIISALIALHFIGVNAAPLFAFDDNCDMSCCQEVATDCMMEQMDTCDMSMIVCETPTLILLVVAPIKTINQNIEIMVNTALDVPLVNIPSENHTVFGLEHYNIPDPPSSHLTPLLI